MHIEQMLVTRMYVRCLVGFADVIDTLVRLIIVPGRMWSCSWQYSRLLIPMQRHSIMPGHL